MIRLLEMLAGLLHRLSKALSRVAHAAYLRKVCLCGHPRSCHSLAFRVTRGANPDVEPIYKKCSQCVCEYFKLRRL